MLKKLQLTKILLFLVLLTGVNMLGQAFSGTYNFTTGSPNVASFNYNGTAITNVTVSALTKVGVTTSSSSGNSRASDWPTGSTDGGAAGGSVNTAKYFQFTITAAAGYTISNPAIDFGVGRSGTGTRKFEWRSSVDSYGSQIPVTVNNSGVSVAGNVITTPDQNAGYTGNTVALSTTGQQTITFRFYAYGSEATGGTGGLQGNMTFNATLVPTSTTSSASNIIRNTSFSEPANIAYAAYQATDITDANSLEVGSFTLQDGGGSADTDTEATTLTAITFNITNSGNIRRIALYDGSTELGEVAGGTAATFTGLSIAAADGGTKNMSLRATFNTAVTDNQQVSFTVASASANTAGSTFAATNAGGAATDTTGDSNRIEVTADRLAFVQQPSNTQENTGMSPAVTVSANDANANRDLDYSGSISITSSGALAGTSAATAVSGLATFSTLTHTAAGTGLTLTAKRTAENDWDVLSSSFNITSAQPEIAISQGATAIATGGTYAFGNQVQGTGSSAITFTISNTGAAALTLAGTPKVVLSGTNASDFTVNETATSASVPASGNTTFTVTFTPAFAGSRTAQLSIANNDANENPYIINLTGTGTVSAASDIVEATSAYSSNIDYKAYQSATITGPGSLAVMEFRVRDGGALSNDADGLPTTIESITFSVNNIAVIRDAAIYLGAAKVSAAVIDTGNGTLSFSGLSSISAGDGGESYLFSLRVTFNSTVTDNQQLQFTISSVTASATGSGLASANAGGAQSSTTADYNRIEVTADRLRFGTQPTGTAVGANLPTFTVQAVDANANIDLDHANTIVISTATGTGMTAGAQYAMAAGTVSISDVSFNAAQANINLTATATNALAVSSTVTSNNFSISDIASGTYRTLTGGTWPNNGTATWERFTAGSWNPATPAANTGDMLIIRHAISTNQIAAGSGGGLKIQVEDEGTFTVNNGGTIGQLTIEDGGTFMVAGTSTLAVSASTTPNIVVESGGELIINNSNISGTSTFWNGVENFKAGSIVEIRNWDFGASGDSKRLIQTTSTISPNTGGYYFGNLEITGAPSSIFVMAAGNQPQPILLTENDFTVNPSGGTNHVGLTNGISSVTIGGNLYVNASQLSGSVSTSSGTVTTTIHGNLVINGGILNLAQGTGNTTSLFELKGNLLTLPGSTLTTTDTDARIRFSGTSPQTITLNGTLNSGVVFQVTSGANLRLPQDLVLSNPTNEIFVLSGGIFEFNGFNVTGAGKFNVDAGGIIKITSADGINASGATGNVQTTTRNFIQTGHYHYVGSVSPQSTGTALTSGSTAKQIVIDKTSAADIVNLTQSTGVSAAGQVYVKRGDFRETATAVVNGAGSIKIDAGSTYRISALNTTVPQVSGTYDIAPTGVLMLTGVGDQELRGARDYGSLTFDGGGVKTTSSAISNITGTVTVKTGTVLNSGTSTFGGSATNLTVEAGATYATGGADTKPNMGGTYTLSPTSVIEFGGASATDIRTSPAYGIISITGSNVGLSTDTAGVTLQSGGTFTVKAGATFNVRNTNGFAGSTDTAVRSTNSPAIVLEPTSTINYNREGAQTVTATVNHSNIALSGTGEKTFADNLFVGNDLTLNIGATAKVAGGTTITVTNLVVNNATAADFVVENNGNLIQINDIDNNTSIKVNRDSSPLFREDYTMWSSPVAGQQLKAFSPGTNNNRFYGYNTNENQFDSVEPTGNFVSGQGYLIRMPNGAYLPGTDTPAGTFTTTGVAYQNNQATMTVNGVFTGIPNNGNIDVTLDDAGLGFNMLGNPYPSPISIVDFLGANDDAIDGTVYFWRKRNAVATSNGSAYGTCNAAGVYAANGAPEQEDPHGVIRTGQGFIVQLAAGNTTNVVTFTNSMRTANTDNQFFRTTNTAASGTMPERHGMWLNLTNSNGFFSQMYAGYIAGATTGADKGIDSRYINDTQTVLATEIAGKEYIIQGRPLPFTVQDVVPLSFRSATAGSFTIAIAKTEGLFEQGQVIYLKDNLLGTTHNLTEGAYTFTTAAGAFSTRFEVVYTDGALGVDTPVLNPDSVIVYKKDSNIMINAGTAEIAGVAIYDMRGRMIYNRKDINATEAIINNLVSQQQVLIVQITTAENGTVTKKIIF